MTSDAPGTPTRSDLASSFGAVADQYDRVRPGYPDAARARASSPACSPPAASP
jgi:hypothetical protein